MQLQDSFNNWLNGISQSEEIADNIIAFNFGLLETEDGFAIYLIGASEYDPDDDDWACEEDFEPENKYFELAIETDDWEEVQSLSEKLIKSFINSDSFSKSFLHNATAITTGFDSGELVRII